MPPAKEPRTVRRHAARLTSDDWPQAKPFPAARGQPGPGNVGFDKVLTDVPCGGDGTIRKDKTILPRWTPAVSNSIHSVQLEIGWRGLSLLRVGGLMVYSTCSLNPVEDEAVVAAMLARAERQAGAGAVVLEVSRRGPYSCNTPYGESLLQL